MKTCTTCAVALPHNAFAKNKSTKDGLSRICRECDSARAARYYEKNREAVKQRSLDYYRSNKEKVAETARAYAIKNADKIRARTRQYAVEHREEKRIYDAQYRVENKERKAEAFKKYYALNAEKLRLATREWARKNPAKARATQKEWQSANPDKMASFIRAWRDANPAKVKAQIKKRVAAKKRRVPSWFGELDRLVFEEANHLLDLRRSATGIDWNIDHMIPLQGETVSGLHVWNNIQVIPAWINKSKCNRIIYTEPGEWLKAA